MRSYYRVMLGPKSIFAEQCFAGNFIGTDFGIEEDLTHKLPEEWRVFNKEFIPVYLKAYPDKNKISAGLACGALWTVSKGMKLGDLAFSPDGKGRYRVGEISGDYYYAQDEILFHRRPVKWLNTFVDRSNMSEALRNSTGSIGTVTNITRYRDDLRTVNWWHLLPYHHFDRRERREPTGIRIGRTS